MGLTQVMLQVKGCEMVCKQRELIPRLRQLSPAGTGLNSYPPPPPPPFASLHSQPSPSTLPPPYPTPIQPLSSLSNSLWQPLQSTVRGHQKGTQTQREMPSAYKNETESGSIQFTPLAQHQSTPIYQQSRRRATESAELQAQTQASQLPVIERLNLFYRGIAFERLGWDSKLIHRFVVSCCRKCWLLWTSLTKKFLFCLKWLDSYQPWKGPVRKFWVHSVKNDWTLTVLEVIYIKV